MERRDRNCMSYKAHESSHAWVCYARRTNVAEFTAKGEVQLRGMVRQEAAEEILFIFNQKRH